MLVPEHAADATAAQLQDAGTLGLEERGGGRQLEWVAYFPERPGLLEDLRQRLPACRLEPSPVPDVDWVRRFRDSFTAFEVGGFRVVPAWHVDSSPPPHSATLVVDPGPAFGTGTHASTRLCLRGLERLAAAAPLARVLDLGCGSAILAIAAARLGAVRPVASDVDLDALGWARRHGELNGVELRLVCADGARGLRPGAFDLVLANLTTPLLLARRDEIVAAAAPGGRLLLAGVLADELPELAGAYARCGRLEPASDEDWASLCVSLP